MNDTSVQPAKAAKRKRNRVSVEQSLADLKRRLLEINDLNAACSVLNWDQSTYMPTGGAAARGRQIATVSRLAHEKHIDPAVGKLLDTLQAKAGQLSDDDAAMVRVARRDFEKAVKVPADHVARAEALGSAAFDAWTRARPANDFAAMAPYLEQILELSHTYAGFFAPYDHPADPMIDNADHGMTTASIRALFAELKSALVPMVRAIAEQPAIDNSCLRGPFAEQPQLDFGLDVAQQMGYDLARGRLDKTHHPFCTTFSIGDVRITTRVREDDLGDAFFSTVHEAGHAMYEQGVDPAYEGTSLSGGTSYGVHESQSRLWENIVARGRGFWEHYYPLLQRTFPDQLGRVPLDTFHRAVNKVTPSLIRTDADEVTYDLHVMLRFELELAMLEGRLRIRDLPEAWREGMRASLGIVPPDDRDGCLQDVHWFGAGRVGGLFQSYTIGNVLGVQFFNAAVAAHPDIPADIAAGRFETLHEWLRTHIYQHGSKYTPNEVIAQATGKPMSVGPYLAYLRAKYGAIYEGAKLG